MSASKKPSILITGCSQGGAGNALALEFAARGLRVFATARSLGSMSNLSENGIETLALDVTVLESIVALKDEISKRTGGTLDYLYNNAGSMYEAPALEADPKQVRRMFDTNVFGLFDVVTAFTPLLIAATHSSNTTPTIVNVASILARIPFPFASAYNATKAAVSAYSDTLRLELSPFGIRVVTLFMGEVSTNLRTAYNINFGPESLYADVESKVKERTEHSAKVSVTPDVFARQVISKVLGDKSVSYIWKGTNAFIVWLLNAIGPRKVFDSTVMGPVGLDDKSLIKSIRDRGQQFVKER
ncbi:Short-chain dehydrogenase/reductase SDR [Penicillium occitanis (nom. inval.)]|nr:hypothetical protein PENOC_018640 [Penicillium occitanis (nom. inval.)]PCH08833.1 Short-chain dehydrogenase/reductase SDR [Penicillium occitanis (nom. inval.)]